MLEKLGTAYLRKKAAIARESCLAKFQTDDLNNQKKKNSSFREELKLELNTLQMKNFLKIKQYYQGGSKRIRFGRSQRASLQRRNLSLVD